MTIETADWQIEQAQIKSIRRQVFVEEQSVPEQLEWDGLDETASHWLAWEDGKAVATARLLPDGHLGRMAVLADYRRQGIGAQLLRTLINTASDRQLLELYLHAQLHAIPLYQSAGFNLEGDEFLDAGMPHRTMRLRLCQQRLLGIHGGKFAIKNLAEAALELVAQADRHLRIISSSLDRDCFEQTELVDAISRLARKSRFSEIKILVCNSDDLLGRSHRLVQLQQRLSTAIELRMVNDSCEDVNNNFIIADSLGVICQSMREPELIWGNYNNRPIAEDFDNQFDRLWNQAKTDPNLRPVF